MKKLLTSDTAWKIYSILIAIMLWCAVMFTQNPDRARWLRSVPVRILNQEALEEGGNYLKEELPLTVDVKVTGKLLYVIKAEAVTVTGEIDPETNTCRLVAVPSSGIMVQEMKKEIPVTLEKEATTSQVLQVEFSEEITEEERKLVEVQFETERVKIVGPQSKILQIGGAYVRIERADIEKDNLGKLVYKDLIIKDADGQIMDISASRFRPETNQVGVKLTQAQTQAVPIEVVLSGAPADGYKVAAVQSEPATVEVIFKGGTPEKLERILTEAVDVEGLKSDKRKTKIQLELPEGYIFLNEKDATVDVVLQVVPK